MKCFKVMGDIEVTQLNFIFIVENFICHPA